MGFVICTDETVLRMVAQWRVLSLMFVWTELPFSCWCEFLKRLNRWRQMRACRLFPEKISCSSRLTSRTRESPERVLETLRDTAKRKTYLSGVYSSLFLERLQRICPCPTLVWPWKRNSAQRRPGRSGIGLIALSPMQFVCVARFLGVLLGWIYLGRPGKPLKHEL